jgi:hypothetical protein
MAEIWSEVHVRCHTDGVSKPTDGVHIECSVVVCKTWELVITVGELGGGNLKEQIASFTIFLSSAEDADRISMRDDSRRPRCRSLKQTARTGRTASSTELKKMVKDMICSANCFEITSAELALPQLPTPSPRTLRRSTQYGLYCRLDSKLHRYDTVHGTCTLPIISPPRIRGDPRHWPPGVNSCLTVSISAKPSPQRQQYPRPLPCRLQASGPPGRSCRLVDPRRLWRFI